jgi:hypothetical protein
MMRIFLATVLLAATSAFAAEPASTAELAKLSAMAGRWKGDGWMFTREGRKTFASEETVEMKLGGAALLIEGLHRDATTNAVVHHALAILAWDAARSEYRFLSALADGRTGAFAGKLEDGRFVWMIQPEGAPWSRFTIAFTGDRWVEDGESSRDGGKTWMKFFEMRLDRVK